MENDSSAKSCPVAPLVKRQTWLKAANANSMIVHTSFEASLCRKLNSDKGYMQGPIPGMLSFASRRQKKNTEKKAKDEEAKSRTRRRGVGENPDS
jgi:hypothetical protein